MSDENDISAKSHLSDEALLAQYQHADAAAFDEFFQRHKNLVFSYLRSRLPKADAEEAFQKTFLKIHRYILKYDPTQSAMGWVMTIARNVANDAKPKHVAPARLDDVPAEELSHDEQGALDARRALEELVKRLSPKDSHLVEQRFLKEQSFEEIAADHGWTVDNTRQKISRLMRKLKAQALQQSY